MQGSTDRYVRNGGGADPDTLGAGLAVTEGRKVVAAAVIKALDTLTPDVLPARGEVDARTAIRAMGLDPAADATPESISTMREVQAILAHTDVAETTATGLRRGAAYMAHRDRLRERLALVEVLPVGSIIPGAPHEA